MFDHRAGKTIEVPVISSFYEGKVLLSLDLLYKAPKEEGELKLR